MGDQSWSGAGQAISAGGVVLRDGPAGLETVIARRDGRWYLPKGTPKSTAELLAATAAREVGEETGLTTRMVAAIGAIHYETSDSDRTRGKTVLFFLMEPTGGDVSQHDAEYEVVRWVPVGEAEQLLSFENYREMLRKAIIEFRRFRAVRAVSAGRTAR